MVSWRADPDHLKATPADSRMLSAEPLLEDLGDVDLRGIDFVAIGGESGPGARPCDVAWIRSLIARCRAGGAVPFVKQLGAMPVSSSLDDKRHCGDTMLPDGFRLILRDRKGGDPAEWPEDLRVREFPGSRSPSRTDKDNDAATEDTRD